MDRDEQLKSIERMRAKGELTEGEYLARKHKLMTEPEKKSALNPVFDKSRLDGPKKKSKLVPIIVVLLIVGGGAYYWFFMH